MRITTILFLGISLFYMSSCTQPEKKTPNILVILTDDQAYGDLGFHGNTLIETPRLDAFFSESTSLPQFYVSPVCAPTRASLLTGRYYQRTGVHGVTRGRERMAVEEETLADILKKADYSTAIFGKWHNGSNFPYHPLARGFDHFTGFTTGHYPNYFDTTIEKDGMAYPTQGYLPDVLTDEALNFMKKSHSNNQSFFCYVAFQTPHTPLHVPDNYFDKYKKKGLDNFTAAIYGMCENIDTNVGRMLDQLKTLDIERETIVVFLSDNGPLTHRYNDNLKGRKGSVDEGGVRVPFGIRWTDVIPGGNRLSGAWAHLDILPTLLDLIHFKETTKNPLDGISFAPQLLGNESHPSRQLFENWGGRMRILNDSILITQEGMYNLNNDRGQKLELQDSLTVLHEQLVQNFNAWEDQLPEQPKVLPFQLGLSGKHIVKLEASQANLYPPFAFRQDRRHTGIAYHSIYGWAHDWIDYWTQKSAYATWQVLVEKPSVYEVYLEYGLDPQNHQVTLLLQAQNNDLPIKDLPIFEPVALPDYDRVPREQEAPAMQWKTHKVGEIAFEKGTYPLQLFTQQMGSEKSIELKSILLVPIDRNP